MQENQAQSAHEAYKGRCLLQSLQKGYYTFADGCYLLSVVLLKPKIFHSTDSRAYFVPLHNGPFLLNIVPPQRPALCLSVF